MKSSIKKCYSMNISKVKQKLLLQSPCSKKNTKKSFQNILQKKQRKQSLNGSGSGGKFWNLYPHSWVGFISFSLSSLKPQPKNPIFCSLSSPLHHFNTKPLIFLSLPFLLSLSQQKWLLLMLFQPLLFFPRLER